MLRITSRPSPQRHNIMRDIFQHTGHALKRASFPGRDGRRGEATCETGEKAGREGDSRTLKAGKGRKEPAEGVHRGWGLSFTSRVKSWILSKGWELGTTTIKGDIYDIQNKISDMNNSNYRGFKKKKLNISISSRVMASHPSRANALSLALSLLSLSPPPHSHTPYHSKCTTPGLEKSYTLIGPQWGTRGRVVGALIGCAEKGGSGRAARTPFLSGSALSFIYQTGANKGDTGRRILGKLRGRAEAEAEGGERR
eukprot:1316458-Amorphochlora_amoeboformis.AAC.1